MKLVLQLQSAKTKDLIEIDKKSHFTIGRKDCDLLITDAFCSGQHALLYEGHDGALHLRDLDSRNGTYFGKEKISEILLAPDDQFRIGGTNFRVILFTPANENQTTTPQPKRAPDHIPQNSDLLVGWPNVIRALDKERLKDLVDFVDENGRKNSVRLADILAQRKKAG